MVMIILVGPQGAGKTTLANIIRKRLSNCYKVCSVKLIDYTVLHHAYLRILGVLAKKSDNRIVFMRLAPLYVLLHFVGFIISKIKLMIFSSTKKCHVVIEDEGYVFREFADFNFIMGVTGALQNRFVKYITKSFLRFLCTASFRKTYQYIIIYIDAPYETLLQRYIISGRRVELEAYINFQRFAYKAILHCVATYCKDFCQYMYAKSMDAKSLLSVADSIVNTFRVLQN